MKRKVAILLAGILAVSPAAAGLQIQDVYAAETQADAGQTETTEEESADDITVSLEEAEPDAEDAEVVEEASEEEIAEALEGEDAEEIPSEDQSTASETIVEDAQQSEAEAVEAPEIQIKDDKGLTLDLDKVYPMELEKAQTFKVQIDAQTPQEISLVWSSEDAEIVTIDDDGEVKPISEGAAVIDLDVQIGDSAAGVQLGVEILSGDAYAESIAQYALETSQTIEAPEATTEEAADAEAEEAAEAATEEAAADAIVEEAADAEAEETADKQYVEEVVQTTVPVTAAGATASTSGTMTPGKWVVKNGKTYYVKTNNKNATGFITVGGSRYYLNSKGVLQYGWITVNDKIYYADSNGRLMTGWQTVGNYRYYFMVNGAAKIGWYKPEQNKVFYFDSTGKLRTGLRTIDGVKYYLSPDGAVTSGFKNVEGKIYYALNNVVQKGFVNIEGYYYYFSVGGILQTGWHNINGHSYSFQSNGKARTGLYETNSKLFYFSNTGRMLTGWRTVDGARYYFRSDGAKKTGWKKYNNHWYYFNDDSQAKTGWLRLGSKTYYLSSTGARVTGTVTIDGNKYTFNSNGVLTGNNYSQNNYTNTEEFIAAIAPLIQRYAPQWGVKVVSPIIAQAILESAHGQSSLAKKYNNFFGLKCGTLWTGKSVNMSTGEEYTPGHYTTIQANFRVFDNMEEGVKGYFEFLFLNRTRYNNLIGETSPYRYLEKIKADGYATSSKYVQNVYRVVTTYNLTKYDKK